MVVSNGTTGQVLTSGGGTNVSWQTPGVAGGAITNNQTNVTLSGTFSGNGQGLTNVTGLGVTNVAVVNTSSTSNGIAAGIQGQTLSLTNFWNSLLATIAQLTGQGTAITNSLQAQGTAVTNSLAAQGTAQTNSTTAAIAAAGAAITNSYTNAIAVSGTNITNGILLQGSAITNSLAAQGAAQTNSTTVAIAAAGAAITNTFTNAIAVSGTNITNAIATSGAAITNAIIAATNTIVAGSLTGTVAVARLPASVQTLASNNGVNITNVPGSALQNQPITNILGGTNVTSLQTNAGTVTVNVSGGGAGSTTLNTVTNGNPLTTLTLGTNNGVVTITNSATAFDSVAIIGTSNQALPQTSGWDSSILAGNHNNIFDSAGSQYGGILDDIINGGASDTIETAYPQNVSNSIVEAGHFNWIYGIGANMGDDIISAGQSNFIYANNGVVGQSAIIGGNGNTIQATGGNFGLLDDAILGGTSNLIQTYNGENVSNSVAAGMQAVVSNKNSFVFNDGSAGQYASSNDNSFNVHATGGIWLAGGSLHANGAGLTNIPGSALQSAPLTNAAAFQPASTILSNITSAPLTNAAAFQPASTILSNITSAPLTNAAAFQPATTILSNITTQPLTNNNAAAVTLATNLAVQGDLVMTNTNSSGTNTGTIYAINGIYSGAVSSATGFTGNGANITNGNPSAFFNTSGADGTIPPIVLPTNNFVAATNGVANGFTASNSFYVVAPGASVTANFTFNNGTGNQSITANATGLLLGLPGTTFVSNTGQFQTPSMVVTGNAGFGGNMTNTNGTFYAGSIQSATYTGSNTMNGSIAFPGSAVSVANGNNIALGISTNVSDVYLSGATAPFTICGLTGGWDGRLLFLRNNSAQPMTLANESSLDNLTNRITIAGGANLTFSNAGTIAVLKYSSFSNRWEYITASGASLNGSFSGSFSGSFNGNGGQLTNNGAEIIVTNGSSFAQISNIVAGGGTIQFQPGDYYSISNLPVTNNTVLRGYGGVTLHFATNCTNFLIDESTNLQNVTLLGIRFTGDAFPSGGFANSTYMKPYNNTTSPWTFIPWYSGQSSPYTNRNGLRWNASGNNYVKDCKFDGFGGWAVQGVGTNNGTQAGGNAAGAFVGNTCVSNWLDFGMLSFNYDYVLPGQTPGAGIGNNLEGEYAVIVANHFNCAGIGYYCSAGNVLFSGNDCSGNYLACYVWGNQNPGHQNISGDTFNHATYGLIDYNTQQDFVDCYFLADNYLVWDGTQCSHFLQNHFGYTSPNCTIIVTNSDPNSSAGPVIIKDNRYDGTWSANVAFQTNFGPSPYGESLTISGNISLNTDGDTDGSAISSLITGNGRPITNLNLATNMTWSTNAVSWPAWTSNTLYQVTNTAPVQYTITMTNTSGTARGEFVYYFPNQTPAGTNYVNGTTGVTNSSAVFVLLPNYWWGYTNLQGLMGIQAGSQMPLQ